MYVNENECAIEGPYAYFEMRGGMTTMKRNEGSYLECEGLYDN